MHRIRRRAGLRLLLLVVVMVGASGCETMGYYGQAIAGHTRLLLAREDVAELVADPATDADLGARLRYTQDVLAFAEAQLGLPASGSYRHYVALEESAVVWNLFAAPRFSVTPVRWCFPVAGCVSYRGYFSAGMARGKAAELQAQGFDVHVGGVAAYSTLGWFDDPLLSTFVFRPRPELAELLIHELAHAVAYVPGETAFNESFATFVAREGTRRWLDAGDETMLQADWLERVAQRKRFTAAALAARGSLEQGYRDARLAKLPDTELEQVRQRLWRELAENWLAERSEALARYDGFFAGAPSNARLNTVADYNVHVPAFATLFEQLDGDFPRFLAAVVALAQADAARRLAFLQQTTAADAAGDA